MAVGGRWGQVNTSTGNGESILLFFDTLNIYQQTDRILIPEFRFSSVLELFIINHSVKICTVTICQENWYTLILWRVTRKISNQKDQLFRMNNDLWLMNKFLSHYEKKHREMFEDKKKSFFISISRGHFTPVFPVGLARWGVIIRNSIRLI